MARARSAAQRVAVLARADQSYPRWEDFPAAPQNVPAAADIRNRVLGLESAERQLNRDVAAIDWTLDQGDGEPWAERTLLACVQQIETLPVNAQRMLAHLRGAPAADQPTRTGRP